MSRRRLFVILVLLAPGCTSGPAAIDDRPYAEQLQAWRAQKDADLRSANDSPIPMADRASFAGLTYYAVDPGYRVPALFTADPTGPPVTIDLQTSQNGRQPMRRVGTLGFTLHGTSHKLSAFADVAARQVDRLFVPFGDLTNGSETYQGGRFLDLERTPTGLYDLDFNRAYLPYCVYNHSWECPIPPRENRLAVAIRAGERLGK